VLCSRADPQGSRRMNKGSSRVNKGAPGSLFAPPRGCGGGSAKNKAARILAGASGAILP
jgi:hypothetical protein